jgi:voltage-gated potassium channel Kch
MNRPSLADRLRYRFDNFMARGTIALIAGLGAITLVITLAAAVVITLTGLGQAAGWRVGFGEAGFQALIREIDSGAVGADAAWGLRLVMLVVTVGGIFILSALIGILNNALTAKLEELRRGRSRVIETGHSVILGWSPQVFTVIAELVEANANQRDPCIVVLGERDKVAMEAEIRDALGKTGRTRVVCRSGSPIVLGDLDLVGLDSARAIIVLSPPGDDPDSSAIKTVLAITNKPGRKAEPYHIVAEIADPRNLEAARMVGRDEVEIVLTGDLISRIIAQTCRQSGLSVVYQELLDFGGDEIYFKEERGLAGKTFGEALLAFEDSAVIGLCTAEGPRLNPPMDTVIKPGEQVIVVSEDDDTVRLGGPGVAAVDRTAIQLRDADVATAERTLVLGWNWRAPAIIRELDHYVAPGSAVTVVADVPDLEARTAGCRVELERQALSVATGDTTDRRTLEGLRAETYRHVIVLAYDHLEAQKADARTLITLLHLRDIAERHDHPFSIVSEMLDTRNRALAEVTKADDFIVSDKLVSLMLAQISENKKLNAVFADLFAPEGSEIYLKLASNYVRIGVPVNFYTVAEAARQRGEVALGYRLKAHATDAARAYGVVVNPTKSAPVTFAEWDRVIVLAED